MSRPRIIIFSLFILFSLSGLAFATPASADYYDQGAMKSENLLSGATVTDITGFSATVDLPTNTSVSVQFSQDRVNFVSSSGTAFGWDALSDGENDIDLTGLNWSGGSFYYKLKLETTDPVATPVVSEVELTYDGEAVPAPGNPKHREGTLVSTDLLSGTGGELTGVDRFGYAISSLPYGTHVYAQFSTDQTNWQNSSGTLWDWDELSFGDHFSPDTALDLSALNWKGETSFYYKLRFTTVTDERVTPILKKAGLLEFSVDVGGAANTSADPVAYYNFNEGYGDTAHNNGIGTSIDGTLNAGGTGGNATNTAMWDKNGKFGGAMEFDGENDYVDVGTGPNTVNSVSFWVNPVTTTEYPVDINGTAYIWINAGTLTAQGFTDPTIYVNGKVSSAVSAGQWQHIVVTTGTALNASDFDIGRIEGVGNNEGKIDEVKIFDYALTASQVKREYNGGAAMTAGSKSVSAAGVPSFSNASEYCVPGSSDSCDPPVGEWKMEQNVSGDGQTFFDTSGNGNNGTTSSANGTGMNCTQNGQVGFGCDFDGVDDYVSVIDSSNLNLTTNFTFSSWIKRNRSGVFETIYDSGTQGGHWFVQISDTNRVTFTERYIADYTGNTSITDNNWHYITVIKSGDSGTNIFLYLDGKLDGTDSAGTVSTPSGNKTIGCWTESGGGGLMFSGSIDQVRIYDYARTPSQIAWEYNKGKPIAHWRMNEGESGDGDPIHDESGNGNDGTTNDGANNTGMDCTGEGKFGKACSFDDTDDYIEVTTNKSMLSDPGTEITISAWIKPSVDLPNANYQAIAGNLNNDETAGWHLVIEPTADGGQPYLYLPNGNAVAGSETYSFPSSSWTHLLVTYKEGSPGSGAIYINGQSQMVTSSNQTFVSGSENLNIGRSPYGTHSYFPGQIDDVRIYNYALTAEQVKNVYNEGSAVRF